MIDLIDVLTLFILALTADFWFSGVLNNSESFQKWLKRKQ